MYFQNKMTPRNAVYSSQSQRTLLQTPGTTAFIQDEVLHNENHTTTTQLPPVASPGFVARRERWKLCHGALTVDFRAGCSSCSMTNSFVTNALLIERAVSCWHLHQLIAQTTQ